MAADIDMINPCFSISVFDILHGQVKSQKIEDTVLKENEVSSFLTASLTFLHQQALNRKESNDSRQTVTTRLYLNSGAYILLKNSDTYTTLFYGEMSPSTSSLTLDQILPLPRKPRSNIFRRRFSHSNSLCKIFKFNDTIKKCGSRIQMSKKKKLKNGNLHENKIRITESELSLLNDPLRKTSIKCNINFLKIEERSLPVSLVSESTISFPYDLNNSFSTVHKGMPVTPRKIRKQSSKLSVCDEFSEEEIDF